MAEPKITEQALRAAGFIVVKDAFDIQNALAFFESLNLPDSAFFGDDDSE